MDLRDNLRDNIKLHDRDIKQCSIAEAERKTCLKNDSVLVRMRRKSCGLTRKSCGAVENSCGLTEESCGSIERSYVVWFKIHVLLQGRRVV